MARYLAVDRSKQINHGDEERRGYHQLLLGNGSHGHLHIPLPLHVAPYTLLSQLSIECHTLNDTYMLKRESVVALYSSMLTDCPVDVLDN